MVLEQGQIVIGVTRIFYGSANGVVKILNDADVAEIADSVQTITWNRYTAVPVYHWGKYTISLQYDGTLELVQTIGTTTVSYYSYSVGSQGFRQCFAFSSYSVNTTNGQITTTGSLTASYLLPSGPEKSIGTCYYIYPNNCNTSRDSESGSQMYKASSLTSAGRASGVELYKAKQVQVQGSYQGEVTSTSSSAYPNNGVSGSNWYVKTSTVTYQRGTYVDQVQSRVDSAYPANGYQDGYWYVLAS